MFVFVRFFEASKGGVLELALTRWQRQTGRRKLRIIYLRRG